MGSRVKKRLLITGSQTWTDYEVIAARLEETWKKWGSPPDALLVSGKCPNGADRLAERAWAALGLEVEPHPAEWNLYGRAAGPIRNQAMVNLGADECLAFMMDPKVSKGTAHCAKAARKAGIHVRLFLPSGEVDINEVFPLRGKAKKTAEVPGQETLPGL